MVIVAAVVLFIASFLTFQSYTVLFASASGNAWDNLGMGLGVYMGAVIGAVLIVVNRSLPQQRKVLGLDLGQVGTAFPVLTAWTLLWTLIDTPDGADAGAGLILGLIAALVLAGAAIATPLSPPLQVALLPAPKPVAPQPYGAQPQGGYGYPGAPAQPYGAQPQPGQPFGQQPQGAPAAQPAPAAADFSPFWFAVPVARPLFAEDGSPAPIAELAPGTWYLAVEQRGAALVAQTQDGRRGVLQDTSGIQRG
ncbi:membrane protein [Streptomyces durhamensis]|uniref:membrane protein n=1 Tax=Streptomyces durhamensis TaxID=68194 RepID=UPI0004CCEF0F|nr:membrane protein [Streptomyces durhamensis]